MIKRSIRNLHSDKQVQPRFCDVIIENGVTYLEKKIRKDEYEKIPWEDVVHQVKAAQESAK